MSNNPRIFYRRHTNSKRTQILTIHKIFYWQYKVCLFTIHNKINTKCEKKKCMRNNVGKVKMFVSYNFNHHEIAFNK